MATDPISLPPLRRFRIRKIEPPVAVPPAPSPARAPPQSYEVGYGKPPKAKQFKPGQSGNPKGRPKGAKGMNTLARDLLTAKVTVRTADGPKRMSKMEAALHKLTEKAFGGDIRALAAVMQLYRSSVPDEPDRAANDSADHSKHRTEQDVSALAALRDLIRDEILGANDGDDQ